jgi:PhnB protein
MAIPAGYHAVTPYLICDGAAQAIDFYKKIFGATELVRMPSQEEGKVGHAEIQIGDSHIMLADAVAYMDTRSPKHYGGSPVSLLVYVDNVDEVYRQALAAGAKSVREPQDQFYGDRSSWVIDPFGHSWYIHTHIRDVTPEEMRQATQPA